MTIVQHTLKHPDKSPIPNTKVTVALVGDGFSSDGATQVRDTSWDLTDSAGHIQFDLPDTDTMLPSGCYYIWNNPDGSAYSFTVPATGGPYQLHDRITANLTPPSMPFGVSSVDGATGAVSLSGIYATELPKPGSYTYNPDGTVASDSTGVTYAYNPDGTVHSETFGGVTRIYTYNANGTIASVA